MSDGSPSTARVQPPPLLSDVAPQARPARALKPATPGEGSKRDDLKRGIEDRHSLPEGVKGGFPGCGAHARINLCLLPLRARWLGTEDRMSAFPYHACPNFVCLFRSCLHYSQAQGDQSLQSGRTKMVRSCGLGGTGSSRTRFALRPADKAPHSGLLTVHGLAPR